jgi:hypothetical protein
MMAKALGLTGRWFAGDPAVSERRALPARSPDRHFRLTRMGGSAGLVVFFDRTARARHSAATAARH